MSVSNVRSTTAGASSEPPESELPSAVPGDPTEYPRRLSRFRFASDRIRKIRAGRPALTADELRSLAEMLLEPDGREGR